MLQNHTQTFQGKGADMSMCACVRVDNTEQLNKFQNNTR